jgi:hypothetical protein
MSTVGHSDMGQPYGFMAVFLKDVICDIFWSWMLNPNKLKLLFVISPCNLYYFIYLDETYVQPILLRRDDSPKKRWALRPRCRKDPD